MKIRSKCRLVLFRFNMVEVALALVVLAIGLSSVMVLFPVGLKASQSSVADNNLGDVAERVAAYLQAKYTSPEVWKTNGKFSGVSIVDFDPDGTNSPTSSDFNTTDGSQTDGMVGLFKYESGDQTYYLYQQYSPVGANGNDRAIDFEAVIRVGWDTDTLTGANCAYYYTPIDPTDDEITKTQGQRLLSGYTRANATEPSNTNMNVTEAAALVTKFYRPLIIEISWPADVDWAQREKCIFRVEMFNENFVPYPQTTTP